MSSASGPSRMPPVICPRSAILHSAAASMVDGHVGIDRLHRREDRHLRCRSAQGTREVDGVLDDVHLVAQRRGDVDGRVSDDQRLLQRRHIHHEAMADAPVGAQSCVALHHRAHQLVGVKAALHQCVGLALRARGARPPRLTPRCAAHPRSASRPDPAGTPRRSAVIVSAGPTSSGTISPSLCRLERAAQRALIARVCDRTPHRRERLCTARSSGDTSRASVPWRAETHQPASSAD